MRRLYREMARLSEHGESFAVATIFDKVGSAPRSAGAKMVVRADGSIFGTIGGGRLEADAVHLAKEAIAARRTLVHAFDLTGRDVAAMDMICGGVGEVLIEYVDANDQNNRILCAAAADVVERGAKAWLITALSEKPDAGGLVRQQCLVGADKTLTGKIDCDPYLLEKLIAGPAKISMHAEAFEGQRSRSNRCVRPEPSISSAPGTVERIAPLSQSVGFRAVILDDRQEYANRERFAEPAEIVAIGSFDRLPALPIDENSYLVIVTRGHLYDEWS